MSAWLKSLRRWLTAQNWAAVAVLVVLVVAISAPIYYRRILVPPADTDYGAHIQWTQQMLAGEGISLEGLDHPLIQLSVGFLYWASRCRIGLWEGMVITLVAAQVATALIFYFWLKPTRGRLGEVGRVFWSASFTLLAPVILLAPLDGRFYYGYIGLASYHNPTVHFLRPFALLSFILVLRAFEIKRSSWGWIVLSAGVIILSAQAKPNYALSILPALVCMAVLWRLQRQSIDWRMLLAGAVLPGIAVLGLQSVLMFRSNGGEQAGIVFAPLLVESDFSGYLFWKFLLSIVFPLVILAGNFRSMLKQPAVLLAWIAFLGGAVQVYGFAESGTRELHGNFRWSAQITLFLLFAVSIRWMVQNLPAGWKQRLPAWAAYLAHVAAGIVYYVYCFIQAKYG
jgi:hypothetical protein